MSPQSSTIMAHWQFRSEEDDGGEWRGFSHAVSTSLENSYLQWVDSQKKRQPASVPCGHFRYIVDFHQATLEEKGKERREQELRRIAVVEKESAQLVSVDPTLWSEYKEAEEAQRAKLAVLEGQLEELRAESARQREEIERLERELEAERNADGRTLPHLLTTPFPGRLVTVASSPSAEAAMGPAAVPAGALGRVRALEGTSACVDFPSLCRFGVSVPCEHLEVALEAELLSRPGSRVAWMEEDGTRRLGVVCDSVDEVTVNVFGADGRKQRHHLQSLDPNEYTREPDEPLEIGDLVTREASASSSVVGMVIQANEDVVTARFRQLSQGPSLSTGADFADLSFSPEEAETVLQRVDEVREVRPLCSVRFRPDADGAPRSADQSEVGIAYAVHADGTAVVDFLGNMGCCCPVEFLEVVPLPQSLDHAVLSLLSECLSWQEVAAQHREEEREEAAYWQLSPQQPLALGDLRPWPRGSGVFNFAAKLLLESSCRSSHTQDLCICDADDEDAKQQSSPSFSLERVEQISNTGLQQRYARTRERLFATGGSEREAYLWWSGTREAAEAVPTRGFEATGEPVGLYASAADADASSLPHNTDVSHLVLARVLLLPEEEQELGKCRRHELKNAARALPLLLVQCRHSP